MGLPVHSSRESVWPLQDERHGPPKAKSACGGAAALYSSNVPNVGFAQSSTMLGAAAFFSVAAFFTVVAGFRFRQARQTATLAASEGLELEPLESGEEGFCLE